MEEFDLQSSNMTNKQITKLVKSKEYSSMMAKKGKDISQWNWQALERSEGHLPKGESEVNNDISEDEGALEDALV
jgi:hypothetical protein